MTLADRCSKACDKLPWDKASKVATRWAIWAEKTGYRPDEDERDMTADKLIEALNSIPRDAREKLLADLERMR